MKNFICFFTLILCVMVASVNAQNVSKSTSITLSHQVANVVEDIDTDDINVRNVAMMQEELSPEAASVVSTVLNRSHVVANVVEDIDTDDLNVRNIAMMQEELSPEAPETNMAGNYEEVTAKY